MGALRFSDTPPEVFVVPRIDDELIDDLFYQEDEIGEMRHTAFMIECGLEEDPPDGPDVEPIPWLDNYSDSSSSEEKVPVKAEKKKTPPPAPVRRKPPSRSCSSTEVELSPKTKSPVRRKMVAAKSGSLHQMQQGAPLAKKSDDTATKSPPQRNRRLVAAKSGSLHGMREAAKAKAEADKSPVVPARRKLVAAKSGTLHGMRKPPKSPGVEEKKEKEAEDVVSPRSRLVATHSGSQLNEMRKKVRERQKAEKEKTSTDGEDSSKKSPFSHKKFMRAKSGSIHTLPKPDFKPPLSPSKGSSGSKDKNSTTSKSSSKPDKKDPWWNLEKKDSDDDNFSDVDEESHGSDVSISTDDEGETPKPKLRPTTTVSPKRSTSNLSAKALPSIRRSTGSTSRGDAKAALQSALADDDKAKSPSNTAKNSAVRDFRNGTSPLEQLRSAQNRPMSSKPKRFNSVASGNVIKEMGKDLPPKSPTKSPSSKPRPKAKPQRFNSVAGGNVLKEMGKDLPPKSPGSQKASRVFRNGKLVSREPAPKKNTSAGSLELPPAFRSIAK